MGVEKGVVRFNSVAPLCFVQYKVKDSDLNYQYILFYIPLIVSNVRGREGRLEGGKGVMGKVGGEKKNMV